MRAEIKVVETKTIKDHYKTKSCFWGNINKTRETLAALQKKKFKQN